MDFLRKLIEIYGTAEGRLNRKRFLIYNLGLYGIMLVISLLWSIIMMGLGNVDEVSMAESSSFISNVMFTVTGILSIMLNIRRWHDLNRTGWLCLINIIPFVGTCCTLYLLFAKGTVGRNKYGPDPLQNI